MIFSRLALFAILFYPVLPARAGEMIDMPVVKLQSLDKTTARTMTFEAQVGSTIKFGPLYIRIQACRKAPPIEKPEAAAFLQIWEVDLKTDKPEWVFSGWTFASSPALSPVDHPVYDVWVLDCLPEPDAQAAEGESPAAAQDKDEDIIEDVVDSEAGVGSTEAAE